MSDPPRRGRPVNPLVAQREKLIYGVLERPQTSRRVSELLSLSIPAVRISLKRLREKGTIDLKKVDGEFLWSQTSKQ